MKIYQIHKYGGEWEDRYDYIVGSYLRKERAAEELVIAEYTSNKDKKIANKCSNCPIGNCFDLDDEVAKQCEEYCDNFEYIDLGDDGFDCGNYTLCWDEVYFRIEEVEVIE